MSNLRTNLGNRVSTEMFEYYESLVRGEGKKLDIYETWATPIIKIWMGERTMERNDCNVKWKALGCYGNENESERKTGQRVDFNFKLLGSD